MMDVSHSGEGARPVDGDWIRAMSVRDLVREIAQRTTWLARKEIDLARTEGRADLQGELAVAKGLGVAAVLALLGLNALVVALIVGLARVVPAWLAATAVGLVLLAAGGVTGWWSWERRVTAPLVLTRKALRETAEWAKERLA